MTGDTTTNFGYQLDMLRKETPWIRNKGEAKTPVSKGTFVEVMYRDGVIVRGIYDSWISWEHDEEDYISDIVSYRILQKGAA